jgi:DNA-binding protein HU-beta
MNATRTDLIKDIAEEYGCTAKEVGGMVDDVLRVIFARATAGQKVIIRGFGTFKMKDSPARVGRNPRTGEAVEIPARSTLTFRAAKANV